LSALRQPGSSFKPLVYLSAIQKGMGMNSVMEDSPLTTPGWSPRNYDRKFRDSMTLLRAIEISNNIIPVKVLKKRQKKEKKRCWMTMLKCLKMNLT